MNVAFTVNAKENLWDIYCYHAEYSTTYADRFQDSISNFILHNLSLNPQMGRIYNKNKNIRRVVYNGRYNIYYTIENKTVYIIFVLDGRLYKNIELNG